MDLQGSVAVVAGGIRGIGLAVAVELARSGVKCVLPYYDWLGDLEEMHRQLRDAGPEYYATTADLSVLEDVERVIEETLARFGRLDILINNIERGGWPVVHGPYTREQWNLEFETTVTAKWHLFRCALPALRSNGGGTIVNISSIAALVGRTGPAGLVFNDCYSLANRSIRTLTETWAREGAPAVRVNELMLGFVETRHGPETRGWSLLTREQRTAIIDHTLLRRTGRVEEVAKAVRFLVSGATFMTGAVIRMDGGYVLGSDGISPLPVGVVGPKEPTFGGSVPPGSAQK
jgi:3-oxoacyl-[acyl-carrier protein] reductase